MRERDIALFAELSGAQPGTDRPFEVEGVHRELDAMRGETGLDPSRPGFRTPRHVEVDEPGDTACGRLFACTHHRAIAVG